MSLSPPTEDQVNAAASSPDAQRPALQRTLLVYLLLLVPVSWFAMLYDRFIIDGDAVAYMDIADLIHRHDWAGVVNGYWNPLYPAALCLGQMLFQPSRADELGAYYIINFLIFLAQVAAMLAFVTALVRLRERMGANTSLLSLNALRLLGVALLVISMQRELSLGRVRPDALLQALILAALAMLMRSLATGSLLYPPLMGLFLGLAYLSKSFAFVLTLIAVLMMVGFGGLVQKRSWRRMVAAGALTLVVFAAVAGPYVAALSRQKHRLDFGDSGALNYAWYVGGTEKMHLEPWMTHDFGSATVKLIHPEQQLLAKPGIYSYRQLPYGTYPAWFDTTFFNERVVPHMTLRGLAVRDSRNLVLVFRYLLNHPEPLILLAVLLFAGAKLRPGMRGKFWLPSVGLGLAMWVIYGMVNVEERYVTVAYLVIVLPLFAALQLRSEDEAPALLPIASLPGAATVLVVLFAFLVLGESAREDAANRRDESVAGLEHGWSEPQVFGAAAGLSALGVDPGDEVACVGTIACLNETYWARIARVRILTEIYAPEPKHLLQQLAALPNRQQAYDVVRAQGAKVLVGKFAPGEMAAANPAAAGWLRLGETDYYALPLNLAVK